MSVLYDLKQADGEALVMLELWEMLCTHTVLSRLGQIWLEVVASERVLSMGQIELFNILSPNK